MYCVSHFKLLQISLLVNVTFKITLFLIYRKIPFVFCNHQQILTSDSSHSSILLDFIWVSSNFIIKQRSKQKFTGCAHGGLVICEAFFSKPSTPAPTFAPCQQILQVDRTSMYIDLLSLRSQCSVHNIALCVIVFISMTIVSIADADPRVVHASVVLHTALLLSWFLFWRACSSHPSGSRQKVPFCSNVSRILFFSPQMTCHTVLQPHRCGRAPFSMLPHPFCSVCVSPSH